MLVTTASQSRLRDFDRSQLLLQVLIPLTILAHRGLTLTLAVVAHQKAVSLPPHCLHL